MKGIKVVFTVFFFVIFTGALTMTNLSGMKPTVKKERQITPPSSPAPEQGQSKKLFISFQEFYANCIELAEKVFTSDFKPTFVIALWRGGSFPAMVITEYFQRFGKKIKTHCAVKVSAYNGENKLKKEATVDKHSIQYVVENLNTDDNLLIVDDLVDTGTSYRALMQAMKKYLRNNMPSPEKIKLATIYHKPKSAGETTPDFHLHETDKWVVFPHEFVGLNDDEIARHKQLSKKEE